MKLFLIEVEHGSCLAETINQHLVAAEDLEAAVAEVLSHDPPEPFPPSGPFARVTIMIPGAADHVRPLSDYEQRELLECQPDYPGLRCYHIGEAQPGILAGLILTSEKLKSIHDHGPGWTWRALFSNSLDV